MTLPTIHDADGEEDWQFIKRAWRATYLTGGLAVQGSDREHYFAEMGRLFAAVMPTARARIACDPADRDNRLGFVVYEGDAAWFVYVLQDFRRMGIVPALVDGLGLTSYRLSTIQGVRRLRPRDHGLTFKPSLVIAA